MEDEITEDYMDAHFLSVEKQGLMLVGTEERSGALVAEIHAVKYWIRIFDHILTNLTIVVHPDYQQKIHCPLPTFGLRTGRYHEEQNQECRWGI